MISINNYMQRDIPGYYTKESSQYSQKRYEGKLVSYPQYIFRTRRAIVENIFENLVPQLKQRGEIKLFDIGCADGSVVRHLDEITGKILTKIDAVDIAPGMIEESRKQTSDKRFSFYLRGEEGSGQKYQIVTELGVYTKDVSAELKYVAERLAPNGYFVYGVAPKYSIEARVRKLRQDGVDFLDTYPTIRQIKKAALDAGFSIESAHSYGIFVPKLWSLPPIAPFVQKITDACLNLIPGTRGIFHETVFVFQKK